MPENERLAAFVADLQRLRQDAGQPSLRKMSQTCHYSHTALSSVLSGGRLPSQELTLAFVLACGGDQDAWRARWQRENTVLNGSAAGSCQPAAATRRLPALAWVVTGALLLALGAAAVVLAPWQGDPPPTQSAPTQSAPAIKDGTDPQEQRCQVDAVNAATVDVTGTQAARSSFGSLTLRYSPRCHAAWPLFISTVRVPSGVTVHLETARPADGAMATFDYPYLVKPQVFSVFGNLLATSPGCVSVRIDVLAAGGGGPLATARTECVTLR